MQPNISVEYTKLLEVLRQLRPEELDRVYCFASGIVQAHKLLEKKDEH